MKGRIVTRLFKLVGKKGKGPFADFGTIVPSLAREFMSQSEEIQSAGSKEIAVFEPKKSSDHLEGEFCVGLLVKCPVQTVPIGMTYMEVGGNYATARGKMEGLTELHASLQKWTAGNGCQINLTDSIIEVYHPTEAGEEVEIFLPILSDSTNIS